MDAIEKYIQDNSVSRENILKYLDQYSIYSFYIGAELETRTKYSSPLRKGDEDPSFSIWWSDKYDDVMLFKDNATGQCGDVFTFVRYLLGEDGKLASERKALLQINKDFELGLEGEDVGDFTPMLVEKPPLRKFPTKIEVTAHLEPTKEFIDYWENLGISKEILDRYYVQNIRVIHYINETHITVVPNNLTISYEILGHYKIYQPFEDKKKKFRNNFLDIYVEGALQLDFKKDFCIITKSMKDIMFLRAHFGWEAVAGTSESSMINPYFMESVLRSKYKHVFIWLDADDAGKHFQNKYLEMYPWLIPIKFDPFIAEKDPTDLYLSAKKVNKQNIALNYLKTLITKHL